MVKTRELKVYLYGKPCGILSKDPEGKMYFQYQRDAQQAISLSMPIKEEIYEHRACLAYFGGLLPRNKTLLHQFCEHYNIRPVTIFNVLKTMGRDCLGAVTFSQNEQTPAVHKIDAEIITNKSLLQMLKLCRKSVICSNQGYKYIYPLYNNMIPICLLGDQMIKPHQALSTHFIKVSDNSSILNQYIYLTVAKKVGIRVPEISLHHLEQVYYIVVPRLDRVLDVKGSIHKVHQESFSQSLGLRSKDSVINTKFFQSCFQLCNKTTIPALNRNAFAKLMLFNYLMHDLDEIKNYSILYESVNNIHLGSFLDVSLNKTQNEDAMALNWQEICQMNGYSYNAFRRMIKEAKEKLLESKEATIREIKRAGFPAP